MNAIEVDFLKLVKEQAVVLAQAADDLSETATNSPAWRREHAGCSA